MKKTILFVILDQYADWEAAYLSSALYMLGEGRYEVKTVSVTTERVTSIGGFHILPDYDIHTIPSDYEALILIGGMTWASKKAEKIKQLVHKCVESKKIIGGICDATAFLSTTGILNHVKHTGNELSELKEWGGDVYTGEEHYLRKQAVSDHNTITANGTASLEFAKEVMLSLGVAKETEIIEWYNFHKLGFYETTMPQNTDDLSN